MDYNCIDYNCMYGLQVYGLQQELRTRAMFRVKVKPTLGPRGNATALDTVVGPFLKKKFWWCGVPSHFFNFSSRLCVMPYFVIFRSHEA